jgi:hypothetical protein
MDLRKLLAIAVVTILMAAASRAMGAGAHPAFRILRPTVVAFFPPVTESQLDDDPDTDDSLSDFQYYAQEVRGPLRKAGVDFHVVYTRSFSVIVKGKAIEFRAARKDGVGYYFIAPAKRAHVEYGVMTDEDLLDEAHDYFGVPIPDESNDQARALVPVEPALEALSFGR